MFLVFVWVLAGVVVDRLEAVFEGVTAEEGVLAADLEGVRVCVACDLVRDAVFV